MAVYLLNSQQVHPLAAIEAQNAENHLSLADAVDLNLCCLATKEEKVL